MFKLDIQHQNTYNEMGQPNPLRWRIMLRKGDTLTSQSGLIKCKDFFNDVVAFKQKEMKFKIYHFDNQVKFNKDGLYMHLTEIGDIPLFLKNLFILNQRLIADLKTVIKGVALDDHSIVLIIPHKLWRNTYYISSVSMMIRLCNYKIEYQTWDDFFDPKAPLNTIETSFSKKAKDYVKANGFKLPRGLRKYWFWAGKEYHSGNQEKPMSNIVHNNGVSSWTQFMEV